MTFIYLILLLCSFKNAYCQNEDRMVERDIVPTAHFHALHEKHAHGVTGDHSSRSDAVEDVSKHGMVPQDVLDALQEISRRSQIMQGPPMPLQINYQIPQKKYPRRESKQGDSVVHALLHDIVSSRRQELEDEKIYHHPQYDVVGRSDVVHPVTLHGVNRPSVPGYVMGKGGVVEDVVDSVRTPYVNVGVREANREAVRGSKLNAAEEAIRASLYYLDEGDHTANRAPVDVNRVSPAYDNQADSRERTGEKSGIGRLYGMDGLRGMGGLGGLSGITTSPGGIKLYNIPTFPNSPANQYPGLYGR